MDYFDKDFVSSIAYGSDHHYILRNYPSRSDTGGQKMVTFAQVIVVLV